MQFHSRLKTLKFDSEATGWATKAIDRAKTSHFVGLAKKWSTIYHMMITLWFLLGMSGSAEAAPAELIKLREDVRTLARSKECARCHLPGEAGALQRILDVYNLKQTHWSASLSNERLLKFKERMRDELKDKNEFALIERFVKQELAFRKAEPEERNLELEQNRREHALITLGIVK